jgi:mono/diheme cytochrome c family protein
MTEPSSRPLLAAALASIALSVPMATAAFAQAQDNNRPTAAASLALSRTATFAEQSGEALFANACQACHMEGGRGAVGAGYYPALADNANLQAAGYPVTVVVRGLRSMPAVGKMMSDAQVAAVVNYVRTHFGNAYPAPVTTEDVAAARR